MTKATQASLQSVIRASLQVKDTQELLEIWKRNDRQAWTDEAFSAIREILQDRLGQVPPQGELSVHEEVIESPVQGTKERIRLPLGWLGVNLFGWAIGIFAATMNGRSLFEHLASITGAWQLPDAILEVLGLTYIPLALALGILQGLYMWSRKVPAFGWILATISGWIIPVIGFTTLRHHLIFEDPFGSDFVNYLDLLWIIYPLFLILMGALIGGLQSLVVRRLISNPLMWTLASAGGMLALGLLLELVLRVPSYASPYQWWTVVAWAFPFIAAALTALPTGLVLSHYAIKPEEA